MQENPIFKMGIRDPRFTRHMPNYQGGHCITNMERPRYVEAAEKYHDLKKRLRIMEGFNSLGLDDMCLVST